MLLDDPNSFTIALPSGRLAEESLNFFRLSELGDFEAIPEGRALTLWDEKKKFVYF